MTAACTARAVTVCKVILDILNSPASILMIVLVIMAAKTRAILESKYDSTGQIYDKKVYLYWNIADACDANN